MAIIYEALKESIRRVKRIQRELPTAERQRCAPAELVPEHPARAAAAVTGIERITDLFRINKSGTAKGNAFRLLRKRPEAFLFIPVPEPSLNIKTEEILT